MANNELTYFTHSVDGKAYAGWFRVLPLSKLEVLAVGLLETIGFEGLDPASAARSVLEEFVRRCARANRSIPSVPDVHAVPHVDD